MECEGNCCEDERYLEVSSSSSESSLCDVAVVELLEGDGRREMRAKEPARVEATSDLDSSSSDSNMSEARDLLPSAGSEISVTM